MLRLSIGVFTLAASLALTQFASAGDLGSRTIPPAPAVYNWSGPYVGLNAGGAWGTSDPTTTLAFSPIGWFNITSPPAVNAVGAQSIDTSGFTGGGQFGVNWQWGAIVLGAETDFQYFRLSDSASGSRVYPCCAPAAFTVSSSLQTDWLWTLRPRLGFASNNWLFYVTGGLAVTNLRGNFNFDDNCSVGTCGGPSGHEAVVIDSLRAGWTVGGGVEAGLWQRWTLRAEYLYIDFGSESGRGVLNPAIFGSVNNPFTHTIDLKANVARLGLNYRFN